MIHIRLQNEEYTISAREVHMNLSKFTNILCVILMIFFIGCSKNENQSTLSKGETQSQSSSDSQANLTRDKAKELLIAKHKFPISRSGEFPIEYKFINDDLVAKLNIYKQEGLIEYDIIKGEGSSDRLQVKFTQKGKTYVTSEPHSVDSVGLIKDGASMSVYVKTHEEVFKQITGMLPVEGFGIKAVQVEYETSCVNKTPFCTTTSNILYCPENGYMNNNKDVFVLYDDGWRIKE